METRSSGRAAAAALEAVGSGSGPGAEPRGTMLDGSAGAVTVGALDTGEDGPSALGGPDLVQLQIAPIANANPTRRIAMVST